MANEFVEKLIALFRRGTDCEREVALAKLKDYCVKHGLDLDAILARDEDKVEWRKVDADVSERHIRMVVAQIIMKVLNVAPLTSSSPQPEEMWIECTEKQLIEINVAISVLLPLWKKDLDHLMVAFVVQNNLYPENRDHEAAKNAQNPVGDIDIKTVVSFMDGVHKGQIHKQISKKD